MIASVEVYTSVCDPLIENTVRTMSFVVMPLTVLGTLDTRVHERPSEEVSMSPLALSATNSRVVWKKTTPREDVIKVVAGDQR